MELTDDVLSPHQCDLLDEQTPSYSVLSSMVRLSSMGNAVRQLKLDISGSDIDLPEQDVSIFLLPSVACMYRTDINAIVFSSPSFCGR